MKKPNWKSLVDRVFPMSFGWALAALSACGAALVWIFLRGLELSVPAYVLYTLSAYALCAVCVRLPRVIRGARDWLTRHPRLQGALKNKEARFKLKLYGDQIINFSYGIVKIVYGLVLGSAWVGCDGIYNLVQALIQLFQILRRRKPGPLLRQWQSYRLCGVLMLLMHLTLTGIVFQMIHWNRAEERGEILVIITAVFAFYKITANFFKLAKDRRHEHPVDSSVRMMKLAQAIFAMFSLQASMFHTFGTGESWEQILNVFTGCGVCLLIVSMGVYMIRRGSREIRKLQENAYAETSTL